MSSRSISRTVGRWSRILMSGSCWIGWEPKCPCVLTFSRGVLGLGGVLCDGCIFSFIFNFAKVSRGLYSLGLGSDLGSCNCCRCRLAPTDVRPSSSDAPPIWIVTFPRSIILTCRRKSSKSGRCISGNTCPQAIFSSILRSRWVDFCQAWAMTSLCCDQICPNLLHFDEISDAFSRACIFAFLWRNDIRFQLVVDI